MIKNDLEKHCTSDKILNYEKAKKVISDLKSKGKKVGLCHGGFDLLHPGHIIHLDSAKKLCDVLIVSVTSDKYVMKRKGSGRPIYSEGLRSYSISSLVFVDFVVVSDFQKAIDVIKELKPSYYIKGPDYKTKTTPGIKSERDAIKKVGGDIKYTNDPMLSTTRIIDYIQQKVKRKKLLVGIDRDGTLSEDDDFPGRDKNWKDKVKLKKDVIDFLIYLQTKYDTTFVVISNQNGVARKYFDCERVEEINKMLDKRLKESNIRIRSWQYCPDADEHFAKANPDIDFDPKFIKKETKRKPKPDMLLDALKELDSNMDYFDQVIIMGNEEDDKKLADNLDCKYIEVNNKSYEDLVKEMN